MIGVLAWVWVLGCGGDEPDASQPVNEPCTESIVYADADGDGFGDPFAPVSTCTPPDDHVDNRDDCDDADPSEYPGMVWFRDVDGDGYITRKVSCPRPSTCARHLTPVVRAGIDEPLAGPERRWMEEPRCH